jgi:hypothetical protein
MPVTTSVLDLGVQFGGLTKIRFLSSIEKLTRKEEPNMQSIVTYDAVAGSSATPRTA